MIVPKDSGETPSEYPNLIKASHKLVKARVRKDFVFLHHTLVPCTTYLQHPIPQKLGKKQGNPPKKSPRGKSGWFEEQRQDEKEKAR